MPESPTPSNYVLVIHGTWNRPKKGELKKGDLKWYQLDSDQADNFCHRLQLALASGPLQGSVWRQFSDEPIELIDFSWTGDNTHEARRDAAEELCDLLRKIRRRDPHAQIHLIAHSHGGNVVLQALQLHFERLREEACDVADAAEKTLKTRTPAVSPEQALGWALEEKCGPGLAARLKNLADGSLLPKLERFAAYSRIYQSYAQPARERYASSVIDQWCESHQIGRLVFLGTPFYHKRWVSGNWFVRGFSLICDFLLVLVLSSLTFYSLFILGAGALAALPMVDFAGWNPFLWPWWMTFPWLILSCFAALGVLTTEHRQDVNLYFPSASKNKLNTPIPALVISAGLMDEALLALSIEPLVFGFLSPELHKRFAPNFWPKSPPMVSGEENMLVAKLHRGIFLVYFRVWRVIKAMGLCVTGGILRRSATKTILEVASGAGFGLPTEEFGYARVTASNALDLPDVIDAQETVDVSPLFARTPPAIRQKSTRQLDFLWDEARLAEAIKESGMWQKLQLSLPEIRHRAGTATKDFERKLQMLCVMIDVRVREFGGMVELFHSGYYGDPRVIDAIAKFLESGERPDFNGGVAGSGGFAEGPESAT